MYTKSFECCKGLVYLKNTSLFDLISRNCVDLIFRQGGDDGKAEHYGQDINELFLNDITGET